MLTPVEIGKKLKHKVKPQPPAHPITMYDSVTIRAIPRNAQAVAGYVNGWWKTYWTLKLLFPFKPKLSIAVNAFANADCLDIERGDATPDQAPLWVKRQLARGKHPAVYTFLAQAQEVVDRLEKAGVKREWYRLFIAHWTGVPHLCTSACGDGFRDHADATQYTDKALGRNLDASYCRPGFFSA